MNGPSLSLFQGADLKLNHTNPDEEEAEHAEEEKRRNADVSLPLFGRLY